MCTSYHCIEFAVKSNIDLPINYFSIGDKLHVWKCPQLDSDQNKLSASIIYDGWLELDSIDPEFATSIKSRLPIR